MATQNFVIELTDDKYFSLHILFFFKGFKEKGVCRMFDRMIHSKTSDKKMITNELKITYLKNAKTISLNELNKISSSCTTMDLLFAEIKL